MGDSAPTNDRGQFLRRFLEAERDIHRYICAILPHPQDARDVLQETALALWEEFDQYDATRPFTPWAVRFALNKARQHASRHARRPHLLADEPLLEKLFAEQLTQRERLSAGAMWSRRRGSRRSAQAAGRRERRECNVRVTARSWKLVPSVVDISLVARTSVPTGRILRTVILRHYPRTSCATGPGPCGSLGIAAGRQICLNNFCLRGRESVLGW